MISPNLVVGYIRNDKFFIFYLYSSLSYDAFASTFSKSRENLRWGEIDYFMDLIGRRFPNKQVSVLDVGCGNGRLLGALERSGLLYSYQ